MLRFHVGNAHAPHRPERVNRRLRRLPANVQAAPDVRLDGCSCDPRFVGIAHDIDCPMHGLAATVRGAS